MTNLCFIEHLWNRRVVNWMLADILISDRGRAVLNRDGGCVYLSFLILVNVFFQVIRKL